MGNGSSVIPSLEKAREKFLVKHFIANGPVDIKTYLTKEFSKFDQNEQHTVQIPDVANVINSSGVNVDEEYLAAILQPCFMKDGNEGQIAYPELIQFIETGVTAPKRRCGFEEEKKTESMQGI
mmetsp:Transcript_34099/g.45084  ORF Transcript_34099/g.45084 Transcript_34099/m.45084 type:complete len:123 (+) Transcript_34099:193-561(+)